MRRRLRWLVTWMPLVLMVLMAPFAAGQLGCTVSAPTMNFGNYTGVLSTPGATPVTVNCLLGLSYTVSLNAGVGAGATTTTRKMTGPGAATLSYQMFQNSSRTINFGNTVGIDTVSGFGLASSQTINIYPQAAGGRLSHRVSTPIRSLSAWLPFYMPRRPPRLPSPQQLWRTARSRQAP